jgi:hypothetical protein
MIYLHTKFRLPHSCSLLIAVRAKGEWRVHAAVILFSYKHEQEKPYEKLHIITCISD